MWDGPRLRSVWTTSICSALNCWATMHGVHGVAQSSPLQVVCGDFEAAGLAAHQLLISKEDAKSRRLRFAQSIRVELLSSSSSSSSSSSGEQPTPPVPVILESVIDVSETLVAPGQAHLHEWVVQLTRERHPMDQVRLFPVDSRELAPTIQPIHSLELIVVHKFPMNLSNSSASHSTHSIKATGLVGTQTAKAQSNRTWLLPQSARENPTQLTKWISRQLRRRSQGVLMPKQLVPIEILGGTFVFQVETMSLVASDEPSQVSLGRLTPQSIVRVAELSNDGDGATAEDEEMVLVKSFEAKLRTDDSDDVDHGKQPANVKSEHEVNQRLWTFGFAGYQDLVQDILFHVAVVFDPPTMSNSHSSSMQFGCHGLLVSGPSGIGRTLLLKAIANEVQQDQNVNCVFIDALAFELAVENSKCSTAYEFLLEQLQQSSGSLDLSRRCLILVDDCDALFAADQDTEEEQTSAASSASSLGMAIIRLLDECQTQPQCRVCVLATCQNLSRIPAKAKRIGRFERLFEMIPPTEAMRTVILLRQLACFALSSESSSEHEPKTTESSAVDHLPAIAQWKSPAVAPRALSYANRLAKLTGGFVARDLLRICRHVFLQATGDLASDETLTIPLRWQHLLRAKQLVKPGQLQSLNVESGGLFHDSAAPPDDQQQRVYNPLHSGSRLIAGYDEVKTKAKQFVELKFNPSALANLGIRQNGSGLLLFGPSGCGKTALVREIASQVPVNFVQVKCSELLSKYFGESEQTIRELFARARSAAPCILFFDEFDAIAHKRSFANDEAGDDSGSSNSVYSRILSTFLNEMDGVGVDTTKSHAHPQNQVLVIAATNRADALDAALLRPGRIDKKLEMTFPQVVDRHEILKFHTRKMPLAHDIDLEALAKTYYFGRQLSPLTGADLASVCKEAAFQALRESVDAKEVTRHHFDRAFLQKCQ